MKRLSEIAKIDVALHPQAINNTNVTGLYHSMIGYRRALAILIGGAQADTKVTTIELLQATSVAGASAKGIPTTVGQTATATITAPTLATELTLTLSTVLNADIVKINGLTFTAHTNTTTKASRQFAINGDNDADAVELAACINDATYGVPGVTAVAGTASVLLKSTDPGATLISIVDAASTIVPAITKAQAFVEIDVSDLDLANGFVYIAAKVTTTANTVAGVTLLREGSTNPVHKVGASARI